MYVLPEITPREHELRRLRAAPRSSPEISTLPDEAANRALLYCLRKKQEEFMQHPHCLYRRPPLPGCPFTYEYDCTDENAHPRTATPRVR